MINLRHLLILLASATLLAGVCQAELPDEMKHLTNGYTSVSYFCLRCGRRLNISVNNGTYELKEAGQYSKLVDKYAGVCNPHCWEQASSISSRSQNKVTNSDGTVLPGMIQVECRDRFPIVIAITAENHEQFIAIISKIGENNTNECREIMEWLCSQPKCSSNTKAYRDASNEDYIRKSKAIHNFVKIFEGKSIDLSSAEYIAWKKEYIINETKAPTTKSIP